jgi:Fe-S cluster assembly protein SufD
MNSLEYFKERFHQLEGRNGNDQLGKVRRKAFDALDQMGIPTARHEEWKYTRIGSLFNKEYQLPLDLSASALTPSDIDSLKLPGHEEANELFFINGVFSPALSTVRSRELDVLSLEEASSNQYADIVSKNLGHSSNYMKDGINALNTAFLQGSVFVHVKKGQITEHPVYIYHITDARSAHVFSQPRSLVHIAEGAQVQMTETYITLGSQESLTNEVIEIVVEKDAMLELYKIQNDQAQANLVSTTHIRQVGKSYVHTVVISLNGNMVRNNLNTVLDAERCEAHLYGLYFQDNNSHIDNHTIVDNVQPNCFSNELYKGMMAGKSTGVFNGKIYVRPHAQKTNAYQSNKNILLSDSASVYTKPQLEIFADDVKCSHGCTVGKLNEEGLFYLRSRGISEQVARSLLLHAYAVDILEQIKPVAIRNYVDQLISERLQYALS